MRELKCTQHNSQYGILNIWIRIIGQDIFLRFNQNNPQKNQMIEQLRQKGAEIIESENWIKVNIFRDNPYVRLGEVEFDVNDKSDEEVEQILANFFKMKYEQAKFKVEVK